MLLELPKSFLFSLRSPLLLGVAGSSIFVMFSLLSASDPAPKLVGVIMRYQRYAVDGMVQNKSELLCLYIITVKLLHLLQVYKVEKRAHYLGLADAADTTPLSADWS